MKKIYTIDSNENAAQYADLITRKGFLLFIGSKRELVKAEIEEEKPDLIFINIDAMHDAHLNLLLDISIVCERYQVPIVALTSNTQDDRTKKALENGARDYLEFPPREDVFDDITSKYVSHQELSIETIFRNSQNFQSVDNFVKELLPVLSKHIHVDKIALILIDDNDRYMIPIGALNISPLIIKKSKFLVKKSLVKTIRKFSKPIRTNKLFSDLRFMDISFEEKEKLLQMEADVLVPLHFLEKFRGILTFGKKNDNSNLTSRDLGELTKISYRICSQVIEIKEKLRVTTDEEDLEEEMALPSLKGINKDDFPEQDVLPQPPIPEKPDLFSIEFNDGEIFAERFTIQQRLGKGGLGVVYLVLDNQLDEDVMIKIIDPVISKSEKEIESLKKKITWARKASHRNIAPYFDFKEYHDYRYLTMAYIPGKSLKNLLHDGPQLSLRKGMLLIKQIGAALQVCHESNIVHGNLKPNNILIDESGIVKVIDAATARSFDYIGDLSTDYTIEAAEYISPEQASGDKIDRRTDIYSLGIIMYHIFTGVVPFKSDTPVATAFLHVETPPMSPRKFNTYLPFTLEQVILKCLRKTPENRFQTIIEIIESLRQLEDEQSEGVFEDQFVAVRQSDQVDLFLKKGEEYFEQELFLDCISEMKKVLSIVPQHIKATQMVEKASKKLEIDPSGAMTPHILELKTDELIDKAQKALDEGNHQECIDILHSTIAKAPDDQRALDLLAEAQKKRLEDEVKKRKEEYKMRQREIKRLYKEGKKLFKSGDYKGCIRSMEAILELDTMYSAAHKFIQKANKKIT